MDQENQPLEVHFQTVLRRDVQRQLRSSRKLFFSGAFIQLVIILAILAWHVGLIPLDHWFDKHVEHAESPAKAEQTFLYAGHSISDKKHKTHSIAHLKSVLKPKLAHNTAATDSNYLMFGIDVSNWQGEINWKILTSSADSVKFVIAKATQGTTSVDPTFYRNWAYAKQAQLVFGAYHYFDFKENPVEQARFFLRTTHLKAGDLVPIVDVEYPCNCTSLGVSEEQLILNLKLYLAEIENTLSVRPMIYSDESFFDTYLKKEFQHYPLWIAAYEGKVPKSLNAFVKYDPAHGNIWQFSDQGSIPGITGNVDLDVSTHASIKKLKIP